ncbi:MAG TPA: O-antigen ligase family protein [Clostridiaceae bacterium]|nr:O-antigen ligase family protein [Clostridiaceae bacterium]
MNKVKNRLSYFKNILFGKEKIDYSSKGFDIADFAMVFFFVQRCITYIAVSLLGKTGPVFIIGILGVIYIIAIIYKYKQNKRLDVLIFFSVILLVLTLSFISILRLADLKFWIFGSDMNLLIQLADVRKNLFALLIVLLVKDFNKILRNIYYASLINFVYLIYQGLLYLLFGNWDAYYSLPARDMIYNMSYGYEMIFVSIVLLTMAIIKRSFLLLIMGSFALACSTFFGSRGSLSVFIMFIMLILLIYAGDSLKINRTTIKEKLRYLLTLGLVITVSVLMISLIPKADNLLDNLDKNKLAAVINSEAVEPEDLDADIKISEEQVSSRTIDSVMEGEFLNSNGRLKIWKAAFKSFLESPIFGKGIYGDRLEVGKRWYWGYSHNVVLELMNHFGIFGLAFFGFLVYSLFKKIIGSPEKPTKLLFIIVFSLCAKLLISDSYLISTYFWLLIGLLIADSKLLKKLSNKKLVLTTLIFLGASIIFGSILLVKDYQNQKFRTIKISKPTVILSTTNTNADTYKIYQTIEDFGFQTVTFANSSRIGDEEENILTITDFTKMKESGANFEDGEFYYLNPYIRPFTFQEENRISTKEFFMEHGLAEPIAYAPPFGSHNSTIEYRTMHNYSFVQVNKTGAKSQPIKIITFPSSLNIQARQLYWKNNDEKTELFSYIEKAAENGSLIILNVNTKNFNLDQINEILALLQEKGFESITYQDLAEQAKLSPAEFSFKNYVENSYMYGYINKYLK